MSIGSEQRDELKRMEAVRLRERAMDYAMQARLGRPESTADTLSRAAAFEKYLTSGTGPKKKA